MSKKNQIRISLALVFGLGLFLAAAPWSTWFENQEWMRHAKELIPKLGDALMIAPILAGIVEIAVARELIEDFVYGISHHIIGRLLPSELREHILRHLTSDFIRTHWNIEYYLEEIPDHTDYIQLRRVSEYGIENKSPTSRQFDFRYEIQRSWFPHIGEASIKTASCQIHGVTQFEHRDREIEGMLTMTDGMITFSRKLEIPPEAQGAYTFTTESTEILPVNYEATLIAGIPTLHATVKMRHSKRFKTALRLSSENNLDLPRRTLDHGAHWTVPAPILTGQCLLLRWACVDGQSSKSDLEPPEADDAPSPATAEPSVDEAVA